jgi:hypothetical protein
MLAGQWAAESVASACCLRDYWFLFYKVQLVEAPVRARAAPCARPLRATRRETPSRPSLGCPRMLVDSGALSASAHRLSLPSSAPGPGMITAIWRSRPMLPDGTVPVDHPHSDRDERSAARSLN